MGIFFLICAKRTKTSFLHPPNPLTVGDERIPHSEGKRKIHTWYLPTYLVSYVRTTTKVQSFNPIYTQHTQERKAKVFTPTTSFKLETSHHLTSRHPISHRSPNPHGKQTPIPIPSDTEPTNHSGLPFPSRPWYLVAGSFTQSLPCSSVIRPTRYLSSYLEVRRKEAVKGTRTARFERFFAHTPCLSLEA